MSDNSGRLKVNSWAKRMMSHVVFFPTKGFLGTGAPFGADLNLVVQVVMGVALIAGAGLAKQKRYTAHGICQTTVLLLNLLMIGLVMWPSLQQQVGPALSKGLHKVVLRGGGNTRTSGHFG
jgi:uncharacterized membrane protein